MGYTIGTNITVTNKVEEMVYNYLQEEEHDTDLFFKKVEQLPTTEDIKDIIGRVVDNITGVMIRKFKNGGNFTKQEMKVMMNNYRVFINKYDETELDKYGIVVENKVGNYRIFLTSEVVVITDGQDNEDEINIQEYISEEVYLKLSQEFKENIKYSTKFKGLVLMYVEDLSKLYLKEGLFLTELFSIIKGINYEEYVKDREEEGREKISEIIRREGIVNPYNENVVRREESPAISEQIRNALNEDKGRGRIFSDNELERMLGITENKEE